MPSDDSDSNISPSVAHVPVAQSLAAFATQRPVAVTVFALAVALVGYLSWQKLPVDLLPDLESPTVAVSIISGDRPPTEMERLYGEQLEQRLFTVRGIREINQVARTGRLVATVIFDWDADLELRLVDVQEAVGDHQRAFLGIYS